MIDIVTLPHLTPTIPPPPGITHNTPQNRSTASEAVKHYHSGAYNHTDNRKQVKHESPNQSVPLGYAGGVCNDFREDIYENGDPESDDPSSSSSNQSFYTACEDMDMDTVDEQETHDEGRTGSTLSHGLASEDTSPTLLTSPSSSSTPAGVAYEGRATDTYGGDLCAGRPPSSTSAPIATAVVAIHRPRTFTYIYTHTATGMVMTYTYTDGGTGVYNEMASSTPGFVPLRRSTGSRACPPMPTSLDLHLAQQEHVRSHIRGHKHKGQEKPQVEEKGKPANKTQEWIKRKVSPWRAIYTRREASQPARIGRSVSSTSTSTWTSRAFAISRGHRRTQSASAAPPTPSNNDSKAHRAWPWIRSSTSASASHEAAVLYPPDPAAADSTAPSQTMAPLNRRTYTQKDSADSLGGGAHPATIKRVELVKSRPLGRAREQSSLGRDKIVGIRARNDRMEAGEVESEAKGEIMGNEMVKERHIQSEKMKNPATETKEFSPAQSVYRLTQHPRPPYLQGGAISISRARCNDERDPSPTALPGSSANFVIISRQCPPSPQSTVPFPWPFSATRSMPCIVTSFTIDPGMQHWKRDVREKDSGRKKNLMFEVEDGGMDVTVYVVPQQKTLRHVKRVSRLRGKSDLTKASQGIERPGPAPTLIELRLKEARGRKAREYALIAAIHAPQPRPPIHLLVTTVDSAPHTTAATDVPHSLRSRSMASVTLALPRTFKGMLTVHVSEGTPSASASRGWGSRRGDGKRGDIGRHGSERLDTQIRLSKGMERRTMVAEESAHFRKYLVGPLEGIYEGGDGHEAIMCKSSRGNDERADRKQEEDRKSHWKVDHAELFVACGVVHLQLLGEGSEGTDEDALEGLHTVYHEAPN